MSTDVSSCGAGDGSRPSARRRSSAITGPRNGTSTRPRANSSATMATSTPDAPSERSVRKPVASTAFSSRAIRASSSRSATEPGPQIVGQLGCGLPQLLLFTCQTDVHRRSFSTRRNTFPDGRRGISATNSTRLGRLYDARESATNAISSWASTGRHVLTAATTASPSGGIGDTEHGAVLDRGMSVQDGFDLGGRDLKTAHLDHLFRAVGDAQPALGVDMPDVAGPVPAVRKGFGCSRIRQIAGHHGVRSHLDLTELPRPPPPRRCRARPLGC